MNAESLREYLALVGSALALISTAYFWIVRANRERMCLAAHPVMSMEGCVLFNEDYETTRRVKPGDGEVCVKYLMHLAAINYSSLPNSILGIRVWLRFNDGGWKEMDVRGQLPDQRLFPANVAPLSTTELPLALATAIPGTLSGGFADRAAAAGDALPPTVDVRVELHTIAKKSFQCQFEDDGKGLVRSEHSSVRLAG
ncbi:hypothetical protein Pla22_31250 [Rubripirellula amarantea]|uniref:Uncharacterized protein n=1 Tax=Rubripirellula amarantea TaxID=2527999 RepID=A0A5C5WK96_9BACT|nr:hypothetical protein [Rubripirellula amarantea]TWT50383.1 hypothetical protein Pla22_31250 [Rubripirellula amarantea]